MLVDVSMWIAVYTIQQLTGDTKVSYGIVWDKVNHSLYLSWLLLRIQLVESVQPR